MGCFLIGLHENTELQLEITVLGPRKILYLHKRFFLNFKEMILNNLGSHKKELNSKAGTQRTFGMQLLVTASMRCTFLFVTALPGLLIQVY